MRFPTQKLKLQSPKEKPRINPYGQQMQLQNLKRLSMQSTILDTLVEAIHRSINGAESGWEVVGRKAVLALLNFTRSRCARKKAARHAGVIPSLHRYGESMDEDEELKQAALHGVVLLSPLM